MPKTRIGQPPAPPPSIFGSNLLMCVVDCPYDLPRPRLLKMFCSSSVRVTMIPTETTRRSNKRRKLFKSRSKKGSLLFHSISSATRFLKQSTECVGLRDCAPSTTTEVSNSFSAHPLPLFKFRSNHVEISDLLPPPFVMKLLQRRNLGSTSHRSFHSEGKSVSKMAVACRHSWTSKLLMMLFGSDEIGMEETYERPVLISRNFKLWKKLNVTLPVADLVVLGMAAECSKAGRRVNARPVSSPPLCQ